MGLQTYFWLLCGILLGRIPVSGLIQYFLSKRNTGWEDLYILNPSTGIKLYTHIHFPRNQTQVKKYPTVVLIPGAVNSSSVFDRRGEAAILSLAGFVVVHWDPEGRGKSGGCEDAGGYKHQDGLHQVLKYVSQLSYVDNEKIGIVSYSYGVTFAGGVTRYPDDPKIRFWIDWEGPSDRKSIEKPLLKLPDRSHLPLHDLADESYWQEREPVRFLRELECDYLRIQSSIDHAQPDNEHGIQCIYAATNCKFGGEGRAPLTRINDLSMNPPNSIYQYPDRQPVYLPNREGGWLIPRMIRYINELLNNDRMV